jgi:hypothetical protein
MLAPAPKTTIKFTSLLMGVLLFQAAAWSQAPLPTAPESAEQQLKQLRAGNRAWMAARSEASALSAVILVCGGAGVPPELLFGQTPGSLYVVRPVRAEDPEWAGPLPAPLMVVLDQPHCDPAGKTPTPQERVEDRVRALLDKNPDLKKKLHSGEAVLVGAFEDALTGRVMFSKPVKPPADPDLPKQSSEVNAKIQGAK